MPNEQIECSWFSVDEYEESKRNARQAKGIGTRAVVIMVVLLSMLAVFQSLPRTYGDDVEQKEVIHIADPAYGTVFYMGAGRCFHFEEILGEEVSFHYTCER